MGGAYAASRFLPFCRLLLTILLPALVDIRCKKPCVRARLILLGWYVLFIFIYLYIWLFNFPLV